MDITSIQNSIHPKGQSASTASQAKNIADAVTTGVKDRGNLDSVVKASNTSLKELKPEQAEALAKEVNAKLQSVDSYLSFERDDSSEDMVFFIKNSETGETLRQVPTEEMLAISENITKYLENVQSDSSSGKNATPVGLITSHVV